MRILLLARELRDLYEFFFFHMVTFLSSLVLTSIVLCVLVVCPFPCSFNLPDIVIKGKEIISSLCNRAQVVGWPPIRSFRKNTMATNPAKNSDDAGMGCLYVKVSMDGAPYLRKVDLKTYPNYVELSSALEKMFSCFTIGELCFLLFFLMGCLVLFLFLDFILIFHIFSENGLCFIRYYHSVLLHIICTRFC